MTWPLNCQSDRCVQPASRPLHQDWRLLAAHHGYTSLPPSCCCCGVIVLLLELRVGITRCPFEYLHSTVLLHFHDLLHLLLCHCDQRCTTGSTYSQFTLPFICGVEHPIKLDINLYQAKDIAEVQVQCLCSIQRYFTWVFPFFVSFQLSSIHFRR